MTHTPKTHTPNTPLLTREELDSLLGGAARAWLDEALAEAAHAAAHKDTAPTDGYAVPPWELRYAAAGRHCGLEHADSVRALLLVEAHAGLPALTRLYEQGTAAERRAVLLALPALEPGPAALPLVEDALRTNDTTLVTAAVGPYAAAHLPPHGWRHAVLKCLFTGVPVEAVDDLARRSRGDAELARMLGDFASERIAAGRPVPAGLHHVLALTAPGPAASTAPTEET
ncbi:MULTISPECIES: EboA domain-containing protein [unclassified Streptomyces]|uniref:EboA domain-containing protein n=1 Tax=unclassified Streptomyces TaxID=2593676 RepID=UPI002E2D0410|nr:EboA domain-containing protein [Streptomyces sp. NBC_01423]WSX94392.1 EboA domain-containing protein [Streptomyces sp. NBC_00891]WSY08869.1 EboA domain-containing protein [Streptomyces sp. NBC_00890]WSZ10492.1 EboA domain-containing protein [Streptomyces sp. NBC_00869]WSZ22005.1 EboA domain-containing protein [Streptomyces sp. NBC_00870]